MGERLADMARPENENGRMGGDFGTEPGLKARLRRLIKGGESKAHKAAAALADCGAKRNLAACFRGSTGEKGAGMVNRHIFEGTAAYGAVQVACRH